MLKLWSECLSNVRYCHFNPVWEHNVQFYKTFFASSFIKKQSKLSRIHLASGKYCQPSHTFANMAKSQGVVKSYMQILDWAKNVF